MTPLATIRGMFTLEQVDEIHDRHGAASTLRAYLEALRAIGVERSVSFITDGHSEHHGKDGYVVTSPPTHQTFLVADVSDHDGFLEALEEEGYEKMSQSLAETGVERWVFDTHALTMTYYDKAGTELLKEDIK